MTRRVLRPLGLIGLLVHLAISPAHAVEVMHWDRLPLAVPLIVGQERVIFLDRDVRVGVPAAIADHLRVQSADGAIYLRASAPIDPSRLQLQDVANGTLILLDVAAHPAAPKETPLEPVRIVTDNAPSTPSAPAHDDETSDAQGARHTGPGPAHALCRTKPVCPAAHCRTGGRHRASTRRSCAAVGHVAPDVTGPRVGLGRLAARGRVGHGRPLDQHVHATPRSRSTRPAGRFRGRDLPAS